MPVSFLQGWYQQLTRAVVQQDTFVPSGIVGDNIRRRVSGMIIHYYEFPILVCLVYYGIQAGV
jgi:hypothetical protein